jgi:hypothetical protein
MAVRLSALPGRPPFNPRNIPGTHFCSRLSRPQGHNEAGRIRSIETANNLIGNRTRDLPACSIVPQPTTLPRAHYQGTMKPKCFRWRLTFMRGKRECALQGPRLFPVEVYTSSLCAAYCSMFPSHRKQNINRNIDWGHRQLAGASSKTCKYGAGWFLMLLFVALTNQQLERGGTFFFFLWRMLFESELRTDGLYKTDHHQGRGEQNQFITLSALCCLSPGMTVCWLKSEATPSRGPTVMMQPSTVGASTRCVLH